MKQNTRRTRQPVFPRFVSQQCTMLCILSYVEGLVEHYAILQLRPGGAVVLLPDSGPSGASRGCYADSKNLTLRDQADLLYMYPQAD